MFQRSELALRLKPKLEAEAKERMVAGKKVDNPVEKLPQGGKVRDQLGVSEASVINWETGKGAPSMENGLALTKLYDIPMAYMDYKQSIRSEKPYTRAKSVVSETI